jgi:hypothetical protein
MHLAQMMGNVILKCFFGDVHTLEKIISPHFIFFPKASISGNHCETLLTLRDRIPERLRLAELVDVLAHSASTKNSGSSN